MNEFRVIANEALDVNGTHYEIGDEFDAHADTCAPLLVLGKVRLTTSPTQEPPKRRRGRPRKLRTEEVRADDTASGTYQRRDMRAEE